MFRSTPSGAGAAAIASSMQSFESSLFLVSLHRYPHALTTAVFALESALKATSLKPRKQNLDDLLESARSKSPAMRAVDQVSVDSLRKMRNNIVHKGFSPRDDELCATLLLRAGVPLLVGAYRDFFKFELYDGLMSEISHQLEIAVNAITSASDEQELHGTAFFVLLEHLLRVRIQRGLTSVSAGLATDEATNMGITWEQTHRRQVEFERVLEPSWVTTCPACEEPDVLVCELDGEALEDARLEILRGYCAACDLAVPTDRRTVLNVACSEALRSARKQVLADFGIVPHDV